MADKILIMLPNNPGDVLMATPLVRRLANCGHKVDFLVDNECASLLEHNPYINHLFPVNRILIKNLANEGKCNEAVTETRKLIDKLKSVKYDKVVNLFQGETTAIIAALLKAPITTGQILDENGKLHIADDLTQLLSAIPFARKQIPAHVSDFYSHICGVKSDFRGSELFLSDNDNNFALSILEKYKIDRNRLIILHHGSAHKKKRWPSVNYAILSAMLEKNGFALLFTGTESERNEANHIIAEANCSHALNLCGQTTMLQAAAIIKNAAWLVSGDTFATHIAASVDTPLIALFAPTSPKETGPYTDKATVITTDCLCFGNYEGSCGLDRECLGTIPPSAVFQVIMKKQIELPTHCQCLRSLFDESTGLIDFVVKHNNKSCYAAASRKVFTYFASIETTNAAPLTSEETRILEQFRVSLISNISVLSQIRATSDPDKRKSLVAENFNIERTLNMYGQVGALLSAWLRLKNNAADSSDFGQLVSSFLNNARNLSFAVDFTLSGSDSTTYPIMQPAYELIALTATSSPEEAIIRGAASPTDYILIANSATQFTEEAIDQMIEAISREKDIIGCIPKILSLDDTVYHAGYAIADDASLSPLLQGLPRFNAEVVKPRLILSAEPIFVLLKRSILNKETEKLPFREKLISYCNGRAGLLYYPEVEIYFDQKNS